MEFTIDRSKWRCGGDGKTRIGNGNTLLLNEKGYMCCLGQCAIQIGIPEKQIRKWGEPSEMNGIDDDNILVVLRESAIGIRQINTDLSNRAIKVNDDEELTQPEREAGLQRIFQEYGHTINFIN